MKKLLAFFMVFIIIFISGCSKEEKFGVEQFVTRMNENYKTKYKTADFLLGNNQDGNNNLFYETDNSLLSLKLDSNNEIIEISILTMSEDDCSKVIETFCRICSVFTGLDYQSQMKILNECDITSEKIKFTDSNWTITVGKYEYSVICNSYSFTLFCNRI